MASNGTVIKPGEEGTAAAGEVDGIVTGAQVGKKVPKKVQLGPDGKAVVNIDLDLTTVEPGITPLPIQKPSAQPVSAATPTNTATTTPQPPTDKQTTTTPSPNKNNSSTPPQTTKPTTTTPSVVEQPKTELPTDQTETPQETATETPLATPVPENLENNPADTEAAPPATPTNEPKTPPETQPAANTPSPSKPTPQTPAPSQPTAPEQKTSTDHSQEENKDNNEDEADSTEDDDDDDDDSDIEDGVQTLNTVPDNTKEWESPVKTKKPGGHPAFWGGKEWGQASDALRDEEEEEKAKQQKPTAPPPPQTQPEPTTAEQASAPPKTEFAPQIQDSLLDEPALGAEPNNPSSTPPTVSPQNQSNVAEQIQVPPPMAGGQASSTPKTSAPATHQPQEQLTPEGQKEAAQNIADKSKKQQQSTEKQATQIASKFNLPDLAMFASIPVLGTTANSLTRMVENVKNPKTKLKGKVKTLDQLLMLTKTMENMARVADGLKNWYIFWGDWSLGLWVVTFLLFAIIDVVIVIPSFVFVFVFLWRGELGTEVHKITSAIKSQRDALAKLNNKQNNARRAKARGNELNAAAPSR